MWGGARLRACAEGVRWTKGEVPGRFSRVRHFVAVAIGNGLGKTAREARLLLEQAASGDGEGHCGLLRLRSRRVPGQESPEPPLVAGQPRSPRRPPLLLRFAHLDPGALPSVPGPALSVRRPGAGGRWRRMLRGPEPRVRS